MQRLLNASFGLLLTLTSLTAAQSYDWQVRRSPVNEHLYDVTYAEGMYVAVGNHRTILTSPNGASWTVRARQPQSDAWLSSVAHGNGTFVAVGNGFQPRFPLDSVPTFPPPGSSGSSTDTNSAPLLVSKDGIHWRGLLRGATTLNAVAFGKNRFVAVGGLGNILTSRDGQNWLQATNFYDSNNGGQRVNIAVAPHYLTQVAYGDGAFIVLQQTGLILRSTNALDWSVLGLVFNNPHGSDVFNAPNTIFFNGSRFMVAPGGGTSQKIFASRRGRHWSEIPSPSFHVFALGNGSGQTTAAVGSDTRGRSWVLFSPDGLDWSARPTRISGTPYAIGYGERGFVIVGANGLILQSTLPRSIPNSGAP